MPDIAALAPPQRTRHVTAPAYLSDHSSSTEPDTVGRTFAGAPTAPASGNVRPEKARKWKEQRKFGRRAGLRQRAGF
jgi:hypothetical protein